MLAQIFIFILNILFPPLAVLLVAGPGMDFMLNCIFFLLAVIPSHIHGMYVTWTYWSRKRKVSKGKLPGKRRGGIYSEKVQMGGASKGQLRDIERMREEEKMRKKEARKSAVGV
jgi:uncharacterized membrane protein YqaE (UPF0057 family)